MLFSYYKKILLEGEKQYEFFWNWYQQKQYQTNIWQNKTQYEFTQKHFKSNIFDDNVKKLKQYGDSEYNKQNNNAQNDMVSIFQKNDNLYHDNQKTEKQYQQYQQQTQQKQYQNKQMKQKQQQLQYQTTQQYEIQKQYHMQKKNENQKQNIWQKEKQNINQQNNTYKQEYSLLQQYDSNKQQQIQKEKQKIYDMKKSATQYDFWKYYYDFLQYDINDNKQYYFWNVENIFKNQYEQIRDNVVSAYGDNVPVKQYTEKTIKKNNMLFNQYKKQNIWQKESDMQKNEQYHTINTEVIQNIVQNSLKEKQKQQQSQKMQYEQQKQSIDEETLFLHITEKLLEQRERSLKGNSFKI